MLVLDIQPEYSNRMKRGLAIILIVLGFVSALLFGALGIVAFSDSKNVCPDGNQCSDAKAVMTMGATAVVLGITFISIGYRVLKLGR